MATKNLHTKLQEACWLTSTVGVEQFDITQLRVKLWK